MSDISLQQQPRALRFATESELKRATCDPQCRVIEWESAGFTFMCSEKEMVILRTGAMGGDVREIHGGWKYTNTISLLADWLEIDFAAKAFTRRVG